MSKAGTSAPPSINPFQLGTEQLQSNLVTSAYQSGLNNVNTSSPFGSSTFTPYGVGPNGIGPAGYQLNQSLSPQLGDAFNSNVNLATLLSGAATGLVPFFTTPATAGQNIITGAYNALGSQIPTGPVDTSNLPGLVSGFGYSGQPGLQYGFDLSGQPGLQYSFNRSGQPWLNTSYNFSGLTALPTSSTDFSREVQSAADAAYNSQTRYLDPQFRQQQRDLEQRLADQGIGINTDAYSRATGDFGRQRDTAYQQARDAATLAGQQEQARLYGENLSSRQQGAQEAMAQGQFNNAARQQYIQEQMAETGLNNDAWQRYFQAQLSGAGLNNQARQQYTQEQLAQAGLADQARQQGFNEAVTRWGQPLAALNSAVNTGEGIYSGMAGDLASLFPFADFSWGTGIPTYGSQSTAVSPANFVGAGQVGNQAAANRFAAGNTLNNQLFNGLGSLGGALFSSSGLSGAGGLFGLLGRL